MDCVRRCLGCSTEPDTDPPPTNPIIIRPSNSFELLILGTNGSGKSTFLRQMQIIHKNGFNDRERREYVDDIHNNIFDAMNILVTHIDKLHIPYEDEERRHQVELYQNEEVPLRTRLHAVRELWRDAGILTCFNRRSEYEKQDRFNTSAKYFLDEISRISENGYLPIHNDIIRVRKKTLGVQRTLEFRVNNVEFLITDVGGAREDMLYGIEYLQERVKGVIYLAALDEYDSYFKVENEDTYRNRLKESIEIFREIQLNQWMPHTTFILFLNKKDVYEEKIHHSDIVEHFDDYRDLANNAEAGKRFIFNKFNEARGAGRHIYLHCTQATDENNIRVVFDAVRDSILHQNLYHFNLI